MDRSRRALLKFGGALAGTALTVLGGLAVRTGKTRSPPRLRPPGAGSEDRLLARCVRCSQCIQACPTTVLKSAANDGPLGLGVPLFVPRDQPCDLCAGKSAMMCIEACPTDALQPLASRRDVRIGIAVVNTDTCLPYVGVSCRACWHACPFPREAIVIDGQGHPVIDRDACVGCGLCEYACLTPDPSIRVVPLSER